MRKKMSVRNLLRRIHEDEAGAVSIETILILGAIALPVLIFIINIAWPKIKAYYYTNMNSLQTDANTAQGN